MIKDLSVFAIIPARGGSKRLPRKNIYPVWGKPMLYWSIEACKHSKYVDDIFVTTEDNEIKKVALESGAKVINRPEVLSDDKTLKQIAICHAFKKISSSYKKPDIIVELQANSPDVKPQDIDQAIEKLVNNNRWEILSVDENLLQNGVFRIQRDHIVCLNSLSAVAGAYIVKASNIHDLEDVIALEKQPPPFYS